MLDHMMQMQAAQRLSGGMNQEKDGQLPRGHQELLLHGADLPRQCP
jgi:hypothetical protein